MPTAIFGPIKTNSGRWAQRFEAPLNVLQTSEHAQVLSLLAEVESAAKAGAWVALLMSYEAAAAFDPSLETNKASDFPLVWAAVFENPTETETQRPSLLDLSEWRPAVSKSEYAAAVARVRELIAAGDTYQVNYTFPLRASFEGDSVAWYGELCKAQTASYSAYLDLGRYAVLSLSPELFFERTGNLITTRPMKGTINRGRWPSEDRRMAEKLATSAKDRAENVMIVDLLRNDLGKVSVPGSVNVTRLFELERYETLWKITSTVKSELEPEVSLAELLAALFPCGSITGAPKIRTMQIIKELEPYPRDIYCGAIGLIKPGGDCVFNVAIRTLVLDNETNSVTFGVGAGITYDSIAEREYEECLLKSSFLEKQTSEFQLLETMLLEDGEVFLLDRHLARLQSSADYFGFQIDMDHIRATIAQAVSSYFEPSAKLRLLAAKDGNISCDASHLDSLTLPFRIRIADTPVSSSDVFLFHKTTNRRVYENAMHTLEGLDDVILWNERGEVTESTIANVVVMIDGQWFTPPLDCGLLAGAFREELLAQGIIHERVISIEELQTADEICLINSVRKWIPIEKLSLKREEAATSAVTSSPSTRRGPS